MLKTKDLDFHPKYVNPFYGGLMNLNFMRIEIVKDPIEFLESVRQLRKELNNTEIIRLLFHNWRPSKVGAWLIGLCEILELENELIRYVHRHSVYCEHAIFNLMLLNSDDSVSAIKEYVISQLQLIVNLLKGNEEFKAIDIFERNSIADSFDALNYLDSINSTTNYTDIIHSELWNSIKKESLRISGLNLSLIHISEPTRPY